MLKKIFNKLFFQDCWRIGYFTFSGDIHDLEIPDSIRWLSLTNYDYEADPFIFELDGNIYIAYEVFDFTHGNGKLAVCDLNGVHYDFFDYINSDLGHKSYPFIFHYNGDSFCMPEQSDKKKQQIYKYDLKKRKFIYYSTILKDSELIDAHIMFMNETILSFSEKDSPFENKIYCLNESLECFGEPITICNSSEFGRNGGVLNYKGSYYRVAQNCKEYYGMNVSIHKVTNSSPECYSEEFIKNILPPEKYSYGLHTLNNYNDFFVLDAKTKKFNIFNPFRKLLNKALRYFKIEIKYGRAT